MKYQQEAGRTTIFDAVDADTYLCVQNILPFLFNLPALNKNNKSSATCLREHAEYQYQFGNIE